MSQISTIFDNIQTAVSGLFTTKLEMSDPMIVENNDEKTLANGYGIHIANATNTNRQLCNSYSVERDIVITISKINAGSHKANSIYETTEKALLEELHTLIQTVNSNTAIRNSVSTIDWVSDAGIERFSGDSRQFLVMRATFKIEYFESLA